MRSSVAMLAALLALGTACSAESGRSAPQQPVQRPSPPVPKPTSTEGLTFPLQPPSPTALQAVPAFARLTFRRPTFITHAPGDPTRLYVLEQPGTIVAFDNRADVSTVETFADLTGRVRMRHNEEGLLGLAFDPDYARNGSVYVYYSASRPTRTQLSRFTAPDRRAIDPESEVELMRFEQPYGNHNGGMIAFGPDEALYIGVGDGGMAGDPLLAGQDLSTWLAKILRIKVHDDGRWEAPSDNPFVGRPGAKPEIWAYGLRNPWRFSFDRIKGTLWVGDVGQNALEEIDIVTRGGNYGWNAREGSGPYARTPVLGTAIDPIVEYGRREGESVTGGYVYRGTHLPNYRGAYFYGDYATGTVWALVHDGTALVSNEVVASVRALSSFGEDAQGELYAVSLAGAIYRFDPATADTRDAGFPTTLSQTGLFVDTAALTPNPALLAYDVAVALWSDEAAKTRWLAIPAGETIGFHATEKWTFPVGTVAVKHFERGGRRLETRVMVHERYGWSGYTYRWNDAQTDATLLGAPQSETIDRKRWDFPAGTDCLRCHTPGYGELLGVRTRQLDRETLADWNARKLFDRDIGDAALLPAHPIASASVDDRARAYLDVNCATCHHPGGPAPGSMDLRVDTDLAATGLMAAAEEKVGLTDERRVAPGVHARSALWSRMHRRDAHAMPPLASNVVDETASALIAAWIDAMPGTAAPR